MARLTVSDIEIIGDEFEVRNYSNWLECEVVHTCVEVELLIGEGLIIRDQFNLDSAKALEDWVNNPDNPSDKAYVECSGLRFIEASCSTAYIRVDDLELGERYK